jgi:membrane protease YdiL (CAAX protease family)
MHIIMRQDSATLVYLFVVLGWMPAAGIASFLRVKAGKAMPAKPRYYRNMIIVQGVLAGYSIAIARHNDMKLLGNPPALWVWLISAVYVAFIGQRLHAAWKKMNTERKRRARRLLPENPRQLRYWIPISLLAGIGEEIAFRGVAFAALRDISGSTIFAVAMCVLAFAFAHTVQGWRGVLGTGVIALVMHLIVYETGGLYLAMAVHVAYDLIVGVIAMRQFMRDGTQMVLHPQPAVSGG